MALKRYNVVVNGYETTLQLSAEDAEAMGLKPSDAVKPTKGRGAANKARPAPQNKGAAEDEAGDAEDDGAADAKADGGAAD